MFHNKIGYFNAYYEMMGGKGSFAARPKKHVDPVKQNKAV